MFCHARLAPLALACLGAPALAQQADAPPSAPSGLVATVYGATAGGIRWGRAADDRGVVGYEVTRDGAVLGTFDALSLVESALDQDTAYRYGVTAIDTAGQRSGTATVTLVTPPSRPDLGPINPEVTVEVYSSTAAELFWRRPGRRLIYTVARDGALLYEGDATSFFDDGLEPGRDYVYDVQASDFRGGTSPITRVTLSTPGDASGGTPVEASPATAPAGLRASVYSVSATELFWERASAPPPLYGISRDGVELGTTDGTSFFDDTIPSVGEYAYEVSGILPDGTRSASATVRVSVGGGTPTPGPGVGTPIAGSISADNAVEVLRYAFEIYSGRRFGAEILALPRYPLETLDYDPPGLERDGTVTVARECENAGTVSLAETITGARQLTRAREYDFDDCRRGTTVYDGGFVSRDFGNLGISSSGLSLFGDRRTTTFSGAAGYTNMSNRDGGPVRGYGLTDVDYTDGATESVSLGDATFGYRYVVGSFEFEIEGGYRVASTFTGGRDLVASTPEPLIFNLSEDPLFQADGTRPESVRFATGTLRIEGDDGSALTLSADNGDPLTANVEVSANGSTTSFVEPWSSFADALDFAFDLR